MKTIERTEALGESDSLYRKLIVDHGAVIDFIVVQRSKIGEDWHQIVRYDCAHGYVHKDCLYEKRHRKERLPDRPMDELYRMAKREVRENWEHWKSMFIRNHTR